MSFSLVKAIFVNRAPFEHIEFDFKEGGINVLSAINGKGKTTLLSHVVDAFYEMAKPYYTGSFEGKENKFYRFSSSIFQLDTSKYSIAYFRFNVDNETIDYVDCRGNDLTDENYKNEIQIVNSIPFDRIKDKLQNNNCAKVFSENLNKEKAISIFSNNILTYFPSYRYEQPYYLNDPYKFSVKFNVDSEFNGYLANPIEVTSGIGTLANWIMDVVLDWINYKQVQEIKLSTGQTQRLDITPESVIFQNLNHILSSTLSSKYPDRHIRFGIGKRHNGGQRISIMYDDKQGVSYPISPNLFCLSSGELALLSLFGEILRQGDKIRNNIQLSQIAGIVLIDEVDMHLHIKLQKEILPELFNLFPNIQFIISSHSPFLNMGLADISIERSQIIDLDNNGITCSPTNNALYKEVYNMMVNENNQFAKKYHQLEGTLEEMKKPLVITEGKTDIKFIQKAKEFLGLNDIDFDVIHPDQQPDGDSNLQKMLEQLCKIRKSFPVIGIFDRDIDSTVKKLDIGEGNYKDYGNRVYAFCIPIPKDRKIREQVKISIEYLFSDEEIKSPIDEVGHRLFFGSEFTKRSMLHNENVNWSLLMPDGKGKDKIIENNGGQAVYDENDNNLLAKKEDFANAVVNNIINISNESWENFRPILEKIKMLSEL